MRTRRLGKTDLDLSVIGLGTWAIGGSGWDYGWGPQNDRDSIETILAALEQGINWIDTAAIYGLGQAEIRVGKALKEWGKPVIVATKCGLIGDKDGHVSANLSRASIENEVDASLQRLGVDVIDLYQIHWPSPLALIEEGFETLQDLRSKGKIRFAGVSNFSREQMERITPIGDIASLQPPYNLLNRRIEDTLLPFCIDQGVGIVAYSPMACGLLTGKVTRDWLSKRPEDDFRTCRSDYFQEPQFSANLAFVDGLKLIAQRKDFRVMELAISWVLIDEAVTSAIVGARRPDQVPGIVSAAGVNLDQEDREEMTGLIKEYQERLRGEGHS